MPKRRAFTLVELLVVVAVIAILASLTMPIAMRAIAEGQQTQCKSNLTQLHHGVMLYGTSFDQLLPPFAYYMVGEASPYKSPWWTESVTDWLRASLEPPRHTESVIRCPTRTGAVDGHFQGLTANFGEVFRYYTPARLTDKVFHGPGSMHLTKMHAPSSTFLLMDGRNLFAYSASVWPRVDDWDGDGILDTRKGTACIYGGGAPFRHQGASNLLYGDGHVEPMQARDWLASVTAWDPYP